jgi:hypothetical protein
MDSLISCTQRLNSAGQPLEYKLVFHSPPEAPKLGDAARSEFRTDQRHPAENTLSNTIGVCRPYPSMPHPITRGGLPSIKGSDERYAARFGRRAKLILFVPRSSFARYPQQRIPRRNPQPMAVGTLEPSRGALEAAYPRLRTGAMFRPKNSEVLAAV